MEGLSIDPSTNQKEEIPMKKILALTLALMLALSLTAALAADKSENTLNLQVNVTTQTVNGVTVDAAWNVDIDADDLTWNLIQTDKLTGTADNWNPIEGRYDDVVDHIYQTTLAAGEGMTKHISITNKSNFDVSFECTLSPSAAFGGALSLDGELQGTLVNKGGASNEAGMTVKLDTEALSLNNPISSGSVGSVIITLSNSGGVYPYEP